MNRKKNKNNGKVIKPFLDFSFKYLFATEESKPNLIGFLNLVLMPESPIVDLEYMNNEALPVSEELKGCIFDIICKNSEGERFLIEMQNQQAVNVKERIIYYTCRMIDRMGFKGRKWDYLNIKKAYAICLMNFTYENNPSLRRDIQLYDVNEGKIFSDKLNIILLQLPCLSATNINECGMYYEYLLYLLKQMHETMKTVDQLKQEVADTQLPQATKELFYKVLDTADFGSMPEKDQLRYESDLKNYMDTMSCIEFAENKGRAEGKAEGIEEGIEMGLEKGILTVAKNLKAQNIPIQIIMESTGLSIEQINQL